MKQIANAQTKAYQKLRNSIQHNFPRYLDILNFLELLQANYPEHVSLEIIGYSGEKRPVYMIIIQECKDSPKNGVMIESGIHAREWITHTTALYIMDTILRSKDLLKCMDFYIIPCMNPDGYEYSHTNCRLWRKNMNRNENKGHTNWGVDLNRNFPCGFGGDGSSSTIYSHNYRGEDILSEPESRNLAKVIMKYSHTIKLYISLHSFGNLILYPWGYTFEEPLDIKDLHDCAVNAQQNMRKQFPRSDFKVGQLSKIQYLASGVTVDYAKKSQKIKFSFSIELPRGGPSGFAPESSKILSIAKEAFVGIESMVKYVEVYVRAAEAIKKQRYLGHLEKTKAAQFWKRFFKNSCLLCLVLFLSLL